MGKPKKTDLDPAYTTMKGEWNAGIATANNAAALANDLATQALKSRSYMLNAGDFSLQEQINDGVFMLEVGADLTEAGGIKINSTLVKDAAGANVTELKLAIRWYKFLKEGSNFFLLPSSGGGTNTYVVSKTTYSITIPNGAYNSQGTITAVDLDNAVIENVAFISSNTYSAYATHPTLEFVNGTTVRAERHNSSGTLTIEYDVVVYANLASPIQQVIISNSNNTTQSITSVNVSKTQLKITDNGNDEFAYPRLIKLNSGTQIGVTVTAGSVAYKAVIFVVEHA